MIDSIATPKRRPTRSKQQIDKGVKLLDQKLGKRWPLGIVLSRLDMDCHKTCILGQLFGDYYDGLRKLFGDEYTLSKSIGHGFFNPKNEWVPVLRRLKKKLRR